jgi:hypothetical protein
LEDDTSFEKLQVAALDFLNRWWPKILGAKELFYEWNPSDPEATVSWIKGHLGLKA